MKVTQPKTNHEHYKNASDDNTPDNEYSSSVKYTEYRNDLMKTLINYSNTNEKNDNLFDDIINSSDLKKLVFDASMIQYVDEMGGYPKIILTVLAKYLKNKNI